MKKMIFVGIIALMLGSVSCTKTEAPIPDQTIKIYMSVPGQNGEKSSQASSTSIGYGDTVDLKNTTNIHIVISAKDQDGPIKGEWLVDNVDNDKDAGDGTIAMNSGACYREGSVISLELKFLGLYRINFSPKTGNKFLFYIRQTGIPGAVGDNNQNDYAFRLDKNEYQVGNNRGYTGYTLYLKYYPGEFPNEDDGWGFNPSQVKNFHALLLCGGDNTFVNIGHTAYSGKEFQLKECKYSPEYVSFSFITKFQPSINGQYSIYFYTGKYGWRYWVFKSVHESSWENNRGAISFQAIQ